MDEPDEDDDDELEVSPEPVELFPDASPPVAVAALSPLSFVEPPDESSPSFLEDEPEPALERRSILAQPEPLNMMVGGAKALRTGPPPHVGQASGPWPWTPWTTSNRWPHAAHA